jgi:hypothetical protein
MVQLVLGAHAARRIAEDTLEIIDVMGPTIQFLTPLEEGMRFLA